MARGSFRGAGFAREPGTDGHGVTKLGEGRCSWFPGPALTGRPGTTISPFETERFFAPVFMAGLAPLSRDPGQHLLGQQHAGLVADGCAQQIVEADLLAQSPDLLARFLAG